MFKSLKNVKEILEGFFENHKQINSVLYGTDSYVNALTDKVYPYAQIEYLGSPVTKNTMQYRFNISLCDLFDSDYQSDEIEIQDFSILILRDFIGFLNQNDYNFSFGNINVFTDSTDDITVGATLTFSLQFPLNAVICESPY